MKRQQIKKTSLNSPRIRFNWGYWDARHDTETHFYRALRETGEQDIHHVVRSFDPWYYMGYKFGVLPEYAADAKSTRAWLTHLAAIGDKAKEQVRKEIYQCEYGDLVENCGHVSPWFRTWARDTTKNAMEQ